MLSEDELRALSTARAAILGVCWQAAKRELRQRCDQAVAQLTDAQQDAERTDAAYQPLAARVQQLEAELEKAARGLAEAQQAESDAETARDLQLALQRRGNLEAVHARLTQKVNSARENLRPFTQSRAGAQATLDQAQEHVRQLNAALTAGAFTHPAARNTASFSQWIFLSGEWVTHLESRERNTDYGVAARAVIDHALKASRLGHEIETAAIRAYVAGDPVARSVVRTSDDERVGFLENGVPIVNFRHISNRALADAPGSTAPADTRSGPDLMQQMRADTGGWQPAPGLYVRPQAEESRQ